MEAGLWQRFIRWISPDGEEEGVTTLRAVEKTSESPKIGGVRLEGGHDVHISTPRVSFSAGKVRKLELFDADFGQTRERHVNIDHRLDQGQGGVIERQ